MNAQEIMAKFYLGETELKPTEPMLGEKPSGISDMI